jgi:hypothetical protein
VAVSQLDLFGLTVRVPPALCPPALRAAERRPVPAPPPETSVATSPAVALALDLRESLDYNDGPGTTVASYSLTLRNPHWGEWCRAGLWVSVERHFGTRPHRWMAEVYLELPDEARTWWKAHEIFASQDEAAAEAAAMALAARAMLEAAIRGEPVETPGRRRQRAAEAHAGALPEVQAAARKVAAERAARDAIGAGNDGYPEAHRRYLAAKDAVDGLRRRAVQAFCEAHTWREFV